MKMDLVVSVIYKEVQRDLIDIKSIDNSIRIKDAGLISFWFSSLI